MDRGCRTNNRTFHSSTLRSFNSSGRVQSGALTQHHHRIAAHNSNSKQARDGRNWIRCLTVCGYIFFVSSPAVLLSYYYTKVWNPKYVNRLVSPPTVYKSKSAPSSSLSPKSSTSFPSTTTTGQRPRRELDFSSSTSMELDEGIASWNESYETTLEQPSSLQKLYQQNSHEESHKRSREMSIPMQNKGKDVALEDVLVRRLPAT